MSTFSDLFTGSPPESVAAPIVSQQNLPDWYQQYLQGLAAEGTNVAQNTPWDVSMNANVADFTQPQWDAFNAVQDLQGTYEPGLTKAQDYTDASITGVSNAVSSANAAVAGPSQEFVGDNVTKYMSPYTQEVVDKLVAASNVNLNNTILPSVYEQFIGSGQFGSTRNADVLGQTLNQYQTSLDSTVAQALQSGYAGAATQFNADQARDQSLQQIQANTALSGGQLEGTTNQAASQQTGALTQAANALGLTNATALQAVGQQEQAQNQQVLNTDTANANAQSQYPWTQLGDLSAIVRGMALPTSTTQVSSGPAPNYTASPLAQATQAIGLTQGTSPVAITK